MKTDTDLIQIVDTALADATVRSGEHLLCRPGCFQCCVGAFAINALDTDRLRRGVAELAARDEDRFLRLMQRVDASVARTAPSFPGDAVSGLLDESPEGQARFEDFANDEVCPVLDPDSGTCDLYGHRPMTCRVFGPPVRTESAGLDPSSTSGQDSSGTSILGLGICELCFVNATPEEVAGAEMIADPEGLEARLLEEQVAASGDRGRTLVAHALSTRIGAKSSPRDFS